MEPIFLQVLNMSLTASWAIGGVLLARLLLRRAPRRYTYWLWMVVLFRLACPVSVESVLSLIPSAQPVPADIALQATPQVHTGLPALDRVVNASLPSAAPAVSANPLQIWVAVGTVVWAAGALALLGYTLVTVARLAAGLRTARPLPQADGTGGVYQLENIRSPFVFGLFRPRIYLPAGLTPTETGHILAHERTHLRRGDHWVKPLAWVLLCVHWFNPLVWVSFFLLERDMELSCDEWVVRWHSTEQRKAYSMTLLQLSGAHRFVGGCPLAFGESNVKGRVKNVMKQKKTTLLASVLTIAMVAAVFVGCGANPSSAGSNPAGDSQAASQPAGASSENDAEQAFSGSTEETAFTGRGLTFAVPAGWTVEEVQTEDVLYHRFYAADGTPAMTYTYGEEWVADWPIDESVLQNWYQDGSYTLHKLEDVTIAGAPGKKIVLEFPEEELARIWYVTMLPDSVVTKNAAGETIQSLTLSQQFTFDCTPEQMEAMEKAADRIVGSAALESYVTEGEAQG